MVFHEIEVVVVQQFAGIVPCKVPRLTQHRQEHQGAADFDDLLIRNRGEQRSIVLNQLRDVICEC